MKGKVKWFDQKKGYGFIDGEDNKDYFVHYTDLPDRTFLKEEDVVEFKKEKTDRGFKAVKIKISEIKKE